MTNDDTRCGGPGCDGNCCQPAPYNQHAEAAIGRMIARSQQLRGREDWKLADEFLPFHPDASHVSPDYRDGWNACFRASAAQAQATEGNKVTVRYDLSCAEVEGAIRERLISIGWTPPGSADREPWGRDAVMAHAAVRYCLGRQTYIVGDCADWIIAIWPLLPEGSRAVIRRDIEEEFRRDDHFREQRTERGVDLIRHLPLGADCDRRQWERVRSLWAANTTTEG